MSATKREVSIALLEWMKTRDRTNAAAAEEFAEAALAGMSKINLGFEDLQSSSSEAPKVGLQD